MSQHDYNIANATGPVVRQDINAALVASASMNSGASAPNPPFPNQLWYETDTGWIWKRDNNNTTWEMFSRVSYGPIDLVGLASASTPTTGAIIPPGAVEITVVLRGLQFADTNSALVQLGTSAGIVITGYASNSVGVDTGTSTIVTESTVGFIVRMGSGPQAFHGIMHLARIPGSNTWMATHVGRYMTGARVVTGGGTIAMPDEVDRVRVARSGTENFQAGSFGVHLRF